MDLSTVRREFPAEILHRINNSYTVRVSPPVIRLGDFCVAGCREVWYNRWSGIIDVCRKGTTSGRITMDAREYLEILHVAERLKDTPRHCTTTKRRTESVAEHSWRISLMAFLLRHEFKDIDINKVVDMCLIHDLGECFTGDIPTFVKTDSDREVEDSLLNQWVKTLPAELSEDIAALYKEMDAQETKEAKLYKSLDKLEALIQHNESPLDSPSGLLTGSVSVKKQRGLEEWRTA